jgi:hypothetical protein
MQTVGVAVAIVRSAGGAAMSVEQLQSVPDAVVLKAEVTRLRRSACAAIVVRYEGPRGPWLGRMREWAAARDWMVTVAPRVRPD